MPSLNNSHKLNIVSDYLKELLVLAFPLFIGSLGHTLIGATDVLIVGRYSIDALASISIANSVIFTIFILGIGIVTAVSIILSNKRGAKQKIKTYLPSTLLFSFIMAFIFALICYSTTYFIPYIGIESKLVPDIILYTKIVSVSMFGIFFFEGIKQFFQSYEIVKFPNILMLVMVFINLVLDYVFVYGWQFIPEMGVKGSAIATLIVRTLTGIIMFLYVYKFINWQNKFDFSFMKNIVKVGFPIGLALVFEFLAFNIIAVLVGREAAMLAAIHSILITIASATFMVPLSVSIATSIKVAYHYGANEPDEIKKYSYSAIKFGVGFMAFISLILLIFPKQSIGIFTCDSNVIQYTLPVISIVAAYQIFDGFQAITGGILKGFKKTKTVSMCVLSSYWLVGAPIAYFLVYRLGYSLRGFWIALAVSLCVMGFIQAFFAKKVYKKIFGN